MAKAALIRPLNQDDFEVLEQIDQVYAERFELEPVLSLGSLNFYARTGHAFASLVEETMTGFVLAQSVWNGFRPVLQLNRLALMDANDSSSRNALIEALIKSSYDAAVYDIQLLLPSQDEDMVMIALEKQFHRVSITVLERTLGSRGQS